MVGVKVGFKPLKIISLTASWIQWCMQVYEGVGVVILIWTCLVWADDLRPTETERKPPVFNVFGEWNLGLGIWNLIQQIWGTFGLVAFNTILGLLCLGMMTAKFLS